MKTAMLSSKNIISVREEYYLWYLNEEAEYQEGGDRGVSDGIVGRAVPEKIS
jgi:hypothetical protein